MIDRQRPLPPNPSGYASYLPVDDGVMTVWQHVPALDRLRNVAVLICPSIGHEFMHAYRSLRRLAEHLADAGFLTFRFEYPGTGDSTGHPTPDNLQPWIRSIQRLSQQVASEYPQLQQCWIGLRLGATLAVQAADGHTVDSMVLIEPVIKGRQYAREIEALSAMSATVSDQQVGLIEGAGFPLCQSMLEDIRRIDLASVLTGGNYPNIFYMHDPDRTPATAWLDALANTDKTLAISPFDGYQDMLAEPHFTAVPWPSFSRIKEWLVTLSQPAGLPHFSAISDQVSARITVDDNDIEEQLLTVPGSSSIFAITSRPASKSGQELTCVILTNAGSVHHAGPNRTYVMLARTLASMGYLVCRMDLENLGDSTVVEPAQENAPYQRGATRNVTTMMTTLDAQHPISSFIIAGICSGAHTAFHSAREIEHPKLSRILLINPLTFYWREGMSLKIPSALEVYKDQAHYQQSIRDLGKWKRLLTGKAEFGYILRFALKRLLRFASQLLQDILRRIAGEKSQLAQDLRALWKRNIHIHFIFSSGDPGLSIVNADARWTLRKGIAGKHCDLDMIEQADHTFSSAGSRSRLRATIERRYGITKNSDHKTTE